MKKIIELLKSTSKSLKHPITGVVVGVLVALLLFQAGRSRIEPRYSVSTPELIAEQNPEASQMTIHWEGQEIKNIVSVKVALWNAGRRYLDRSSMSATDPVRIMPSEDIRILSVQAIRTSRQNLRLLTPIEHDAISGNDYVRVAIDGDEALDKEDGGLIKVLYSGSKDCRFRILGRVKGCPSGFKELNWKSVASPRRTKWHTIVIAGFVISYFLMGVASAVLGIRRLRRGYVGRGVLFIGQSIAVIVFFTLFGFIRFRFLLGPPWIE